jgi:DNA-binding PadR family transcriptional regulator
VIARLISWGFVAEATPEGDVEPHPGRTRRYYALTRAGRSALAEEAARLKGAAALAEKRLRVAGGRR